MGKRIRYTEEFKLGVTSKLLTVSITLRGLQPLGRPRSLRQRFERHCEYRRPLRCLHSDSKDEKQWGKQSWQL